MFYRSLALLILLPTLAIGDDVPELSKDAIQAAESITEGDVLTAVSFLASDEMAGRNTPSKELTIASAYVAARFRGAGLEGLEDDGSYFQVHQFSMSQPPSEPVSLVLEDGTAKTSMGLLSAADEATEVSGKVLSEKEALAADSPQIVTVDELRMPPQASQQTGLVVATLSRRLRALSNRGVKLVLMDCGDQSVLADVAAALQRQPIANKSGLRPKCAVVLVSKASDLVGQNVTAKIEAQQSVSVPVRNVIGVIRGSHEELSKQAIFVTAHLDHIGTKSTGDDLVNNGADDNATGVTTVVQLADAFSRLKVRPKRSIVFATFWGEEKGLLGSREFAKNPRWPLADIVANVNIEMVGRPETDAREKAWMTGWSHSNLGDLMNTGSMRIGVEIFNREDVGEMLYSRSDNYPLAQKGVVAHSFSAGSLHSDYHQPGDEWEKLDIPHMTKVIQGLFAGVHYVADSDVEVKATDK